MRVVRMPDGSVTIDPSGRMAGRGAYVCREAGCLNRAVAKGALARALRSGLPPDVQAVIAASATDYTMTDIIQTDTIEGGARGQE